MEDGAKGVKMSKPDELLTAVRSLEQVTEALHELFLDITQGTEPRPRNDEERTIGPAILVEVLNSAPPMIRDHIEKALEMIKEIREQII